MISSIGEARNTLGGGRDRLTEEEVRTIVDFFKLLIEIEAKQSVNRDE